MSNILIVRDNTIKTGDEALLEHQAIIGITRSILANYSRETSGMSVSEHKILVPAHLDILPLLALVADDYTELVEPEPEKVNKTAPFILYWDELSEPANNDYSTRSFLHPRWFGFYSERSTLQTKVYQHQPNVCVLLGGTRETIEKLRGLDYTFKHLIAFSSLRSLNEEDEFNLSNTAKRIIIADDQFEATITSSMRKLNLRSDNFQRFGYWSNMYGPEESLPDLEPFVAFGVAFEMAMFLEDRLS
jgi:hypothetical protein